MVRFIVMVRANTTQNLNTDPDPNPQNWIVEGRP